MFHLILTVMSIALMAMLGTATATYLNPEAVRVSEWQQRLETTFLHLEKGYQSYVRAGTTHIRQNSYDAEGNLDAYWFEEVFSATAPIEDFVTPPYMPGNTTWDFSTGNGGVYFCMHGQFAEEPGKAATNLLAMFGPQYVVSNSCGAQVSSDPSSYSNMAVTYWVRPYNE